MKRLINIITLSVTVGFSAGCSIVVPFLDKSWVDNPSFEGGKTMQPLTVSSNLANNNANTQQATPKKSTAAVTTAPVTDLHLSSPAKAMPTPKSTTSPEAAVDDSTTESTDENLTETPLDKPISLEPLGTPKKGTLGTGGFKTQ
ncbi:hypothetical protein [Beggiatoa leptomitoformis]|uniref:Lipoprotein n=1 Tax=Beggiatoa leptomitoformis TaxID=288004 RepID=A0A2N9YIJ8_9GAMM|nr:hypothetical protein [Beggiatoa leptomitoformis]ALG67459.2 hypothetical protein AL038_06760 [Beggiatoa leptomitoformis]AUI70324.2 hypothetical protein BLE401_17545 [Beggiatoa leptomitoformis]